jgi:hypothetical protein
VFRLPVPPRTATTVGRPAKHGGEFCFADPGTWPEPDTVTFTETNRYGGRVRDGLGSAASAADPPRGLVEVRR